jgi:hypothetical protein
MEKERYILIAIDIRATDFEGEPHDSTEPYDLIPILKILVDDLEEAPGLLGFALGNECVSITANCPRVLTST